MRRAIMKARSITVCFAAILFLSAPAARARDARTDVYLGYSRVGANLYSPNTPGMNGWQLAMHIKPIPFVGIEGDVSRYGASIGAGSQHATLIMFGPRLTVGAARISVFAHALGGIDHFTSNVVNPFPAASYTAISYALGGGMDFPLLLPGLKLRVTGDYLGNSNAPSAPSPSHYRIGFGVAYHF
jgi:Outer membrane protein beta-barrel domain